MPPLNNDFESNVPQLFILDSRTFVAKSALSRLRALWGALSAQIWCVGAQKHFDRPGQGYLVPIKKNRVPINLADVWIGAILCMVVGAIAPWRLLYFPIS